MNAIARRFIDAARCPLSMREGRSGNGLWSIRRERMTPAWAEIAGHENLTVLACHNEATLHQEHGETIMEDSDRELQKHLPVWLHARGRVLVTGLGLGCVVRGLLASAAIEHVDVIEREPWLFETVWPEFAGEGRTRFHLRDAFEFDPRGCQWDYAWHDLCGDRLQIRHLELMRRFAPYVRHAQGAWGFDSWVRRRLPPRFRMAA
jgi:hypothetical protein